MKKSIKTETSLLTSHIGFWLRLISNNVSSAFSHKLEKMGVTIAEWVILREMYNSSATISSSVIAQLTGLTRGAVSKLISRLLEKGLVTRKESKNDRRYQDIQLTETAIKLIPKLAKLADQNDDEFFFGLTQLERETLINILKKTASLHKLTKLPID